ncbi:transcription termination factor MTERF6, chloroplastic/mitochondrial-like [Mangifera indica]|uniref:transcription termination factor MTERF6, chloroplastic/mitochondrial-like n=1 Tax=Mangifera indica TaxID=29780 RepID=UPI001CFB571D|nr:transcription termination factor MTERF6, chloroplastic/mitochondrial-like [Mangifera indica]
MFSFLCKTLLRYHGRDAYFCNHNKFQDLVCPVFVKHIATNSKKQSFTVSYLINSCGLSPESASRASEKVQFETSLKPNLVLTCFKKNGFSETQISDLIKKCPTMLLYSPEKILSPKLEFFHSIGFASADLAKIICCYPRILQSSLKNRLIPCFIYLSDLLQSTEKTVTVVKRYPAIIYHDLQNLLPPTVNYLRDTGVPEPKIIMFLYNWPMTLIYYPGLKEAVDFKFDLYKRCGWFEEEILTAYRKHPWCMMKSENKIMAVMDFFVKKMGWEPSAIAERSILFSLSMEKRIIPRASFLQYLLAKGLLENKVLSATP